MDERIVASGCSATADSFACQCDAVLSAVAFCPVWKDPVVFPVKCSTLSDSDSERMHWSDPWRPYLIQVSSQICREL